MADNYNIVFNYIRESEKAFFVRKKTKAKDLHFWIPKSVVNDFDKYEQEKSVYKDVKYKRNRIKLNLPKWYIDKCIGFYV